MLKKKAIKTPFNRYFKSVKSWLVNQVTSSQVHEYLFSRAGRDFSSILGALDLY